MRMNKIKYSLTVIALSCNFLTLSGCDFLDRSGVYPQTYCPPSFPICDPPPPKSQGTIYQEGHEITLFSDRVAHRIGDILTVRLEEMTQGEKKAKTKTKKVASNDFPTPVIFNAQVPPLTVSTKTDQEFDGEGEVDQHNKLRGTISVTVMQVLTNGNLIIQGESWVTINEGREFVRLCGIVRPEDIDPNNTVSSQRVANARITYTGGGQVGNSSRGGFMTQFFSWLWPV